MRKLDVYRGRVAVRREGQWFWANIAPGFCAVACDNAPNRHHALCRDGQFGHVVYHADRYVEIVSQMSEADIAKLNIEKFGLVETIDPSEDV